MRRTNTKISTARERARRGIIRRVDILSFLFGFSDAFLLYLLSTYFRQAAGSDNVSFFYLVPGVTILVLLFYFHTLVEKLGKVMLLALFFMTLTASSFAVILLPVNLAGAVVLMGVIIFINLVWVNLDVILEGFSEDHTSGRTRGLYLTIMNAGFLFAPLASSRILTHWGFDGIFFMSLLIYGTLLLVVLMCLRNVNHRYKSHIRPREILQKVRQRMDIMRVYWISFALEFAFAVMVVYVPIHLLGLGLGWEQMGIIFTWMLVPFIFIQYPLGLFADKWAGEKEGLIACLILMAVTAAIVFTIDSREPWVWAVALFATRIGYAGVEVLRDSYFYKRIKGNDGDIIAFFRTTRPVSHIVAALLSGVVLSIFPVQSVFLLVTLVSLLVLWPAFRLEDNPAERERA